MTTSRGNSDIYGGLSPLEAPAYAVSDAARYLGLPASTVRSWVLGRGYPVREGRKEAEPVIRIVDPEGRTLSFLDLVEVHVLAAITRHHKVRLPPVRKALRYLEEKLRVEHPLRSVSMQTDGKDLFVERYGGLVNVSRDGQLAMKKVLELHLRRIERDPTTGVPVRLFPFTTSRPETEEARLITIDPRLQFGRPCIAATGVPTVEVAERFKAGEPVDELAADFGCEREQIDAAIRYELTEPRAA